MLKDGAQREDVGPIDEQRGADGFFEGAVEVQHEKGHGDGEDAVAEAARRSMLCAEMRL